MYIIGCKPLAVYYRNLLKIENIKPFLFTTLGSGISGTIIKAYTQLSFDIKGILRKTEIKGVIK